MLVPKWDPFHQVVSFMNASEEEEKDMPFDSLR
jgi:hypothetical protein